MWKRTSMFFTAIAVTMMISLSVFAEDTGIQTNIEPEYVIYAGLAPPVDSIAGDVVKYDNAYKMLMNTSIEFIHLKLEKRKPDKEMKLNYPVLKVSNDAKMQNQNFDHVFLI